MATTTKPRPGVEEAPAAPEEPEAGSDPSDQSDAGESFLAQKAGDDARTIHARMLAVLDELPAIGKTQRNTQQNFMFRGHDDVLNALNPLLAKHGIFIVPQVIERVTDQRQTGSGKVMFEVNLHVEYRFWGATGDYIAASTWGEGTDMGDKATNKAMTMAFKNVLIQAFAIASEEFRDTDGEMPEAVVPKGSQAQAEARQAEARKESMAKRIMQLSVDLDAQTGQTAGTWEAAIEEAVLRDYGVPFGELKNEELIEVGKYLKGRVDEGIAEMPDTIRVQPF